MPQIRRRWPGTRIRVRGHAGFYRHACEDAGLDILGLRAHAREPWLANAQVPAPGRRHRPGRAADSVGSMHATAR